MRFILCVFVLSRVFGLSFGQAATFELKDGDRVAFLGDAFIERMQVHNHLELRLQLRGLTGILSFVILDGAATRREAIPALVLACSRLAANLPMRAGNNCRNKSNWCNPPWCSLVMVWQVPLKIRLNNSVKTYAHLKPPSLRLLTGLCDLSCCHLCVTNTWVVSCPIPQRIIFSLRHTPRS